MRAGHEGGGAEGHVQLVARAVVIAHRLSPAFGDPHREEGGDEGRVELVQRRVHVPAIKVREIAIVRGRDGVFVEFPVVRVHQGDVLEALV